MSGMRPLALGVAALIWGSALVGCGSDSNDGGKSSGGGASGSGGSGGVSSGGASSGGVSSGGGGVSSGGAAGSASGGTAGAASGGASGAGGAPSGGGAGGATGGGGAGTGGASGAGNLWQPKPGTTWQWQLTGTIDTSVDAAMFDIDLFDAKQSVIDALHAMGRVVICYFSAGSREDWRPDAGSFKASDYGKGVAGWSGENWLDVRSANVRSIMQKRLDLAVSKKCDGVEPDNVDGYQNSSGFPLTEAHQLDYNNFLATESHARKLSVGLKNALDLVPKLVASFDWALNEECLAYKECGLLKPFITANKAVFHVEYVDNSGQGAAKKGSVCGQSTIAGFSTLIKTWDLDAWRLTCP